MYNTRATSLIQKNGAVAGVKTKNENDAKEMTFNGKAIIVSTGGFGGSEELWTKYRPELTGYVTTNHPGATGDGIRMIEEVGGALVDIEQIQIHPTVEQATSVLISESVRGSGAILINQEGKRFVNDLETRDKVSAAIIALPEKSAYVFFDETLRKKKAEIDKYISKGFVVEGSTLEELAQKLQMDAATLTNTVNTWNESVAKGKDDAFGRTTGMGISLNQAPYYAIKIAPGVHHTMGGVKINTNTEVIGVNDAVIPALFAAGEVTGGVHGGNRLGGNAVCDIIVFGRQAGLNASKYAKANGGKGTGATTTTTKKAEPSTIKAGLAPQFKNGEYSATAMGNNGEVVVTAIVENGFITKITAKHKETESIFMQVEETLIPNIIYEQSTDVDSISGATYSSDAVKEAMNNIIDQAKK